MVLRVIGGLTAVLLVISVCGISAVQWSASSTRRRSVPTLETTRQQEDGDEADRVATATTDSAVPELPTDLQPFPRFLDVGGTVCQPLGDPNSAAAVFAFLATGCPISNGSVPELNRLHAVFAELGFEFYGVICDPHTSRREAAEHAKAYDIAFPVLLDVAGELQAMLKATHTPQGIVVDRDGNVVYSGRIDDRYLEIGRPRPAAQNRELYEALSAVLRGQSPAIAYTRPVGCLLEPRRAVVEKGPTYCRDVAPILFANCVSCHREGEATPFPLTSYSDASRRASQIASVVEQRIMPPWKPVADFGHFRNERRLSDAEIDVIGRWARSGAPQGDEADLPPLPKFEFGWQLGEPDLVLEMPESIEIPAEGSDIYQHFVIPTELTEDKLVEAFEFRPGNAAVVHHAWLYFDTSGEARRLDEADRSLGYERFGGPGFRPAANLGGWGPGGLPRRLPNGFGRPVPAGSDLVLQIHYHPTGKVERDRSKVGFYFAPVSRQVVTEIMVADVDLKIPAGTARHRFEASYTLPVAVSLLDASPHMHLLGREIEVTATRPDGEIVPLIRIDDWNFFWQDHYVYREPVRLPAGTRIDLVAYYDNSESNPHNPNSPPRTVGFGEQSDDEMGTCYFQATTDRHDDLIVLERHASQYFADMMERAK